MLLSEPAALWPRSRPASGRSWTLRAAIGTAVLFVSVQALTAGYGFGYGEHTVLSLKGISWADPTALVNDWFNASAPQPHVLFDVVTWFGASLGVLAEVYLLYWLASLAVFATANALLAEHWLPGRLRDLQFAVLVLVVAGPYFALGTFLIIHGQAVPNALGGALGFLVAVLLLRRWWRAAIVAGIVTTLVHIQHGTVVAFLLLVAFAISPDRRGVRRFPFVIVAIGAIVLTVSLQRGLFVGNTDFAEICEVASPGHCNPDTWPPNVVRGGLSMLVLGALAPLVAGRADRLAVALVLAPALLVAGSLVADLADVPAAGDLSRRLFVYRFVMVVAPFAAWTVVLSLTRAVAGRWYGVAMAVVGLGLLSWWLRLPLAVIDRARPEGRDEAAALMLLAAAAAVVALAVAGVVCRRGRSGLGVSTALAVVAALALSLGLLAAGSPRVDHADFAVSYSPQDGMPTIAREMASALPVGSVLAAPPDLNWLPLLTRRAVVATCKNVPYGGDPWRQYKQRLAALGVEGEYGRCASEGYHALETAQLAALAPAFGATHVLVMPEGAAYEEVLARWPVVYESGGTMRWVVAEIPQEPRP